MNNNLLTRFVGRFSAQFALIALLAPFAALGAAGDVDGFDPGLNFSPYNVAVQPDGAILIGGSFTRLSRCLSRFSQAGSWDAGFNPNPSALVDTLAVQDDGKILFSGLYTTVGGTPRQYLARVLAGSTLDGAFNPAPNNLVNSIAFQPDGRMLVGGSFFSWGGVPRTRLVRLNVDGTLDSGFTNNINGKVNCVWPLPSGQVLIGGTFTTVDGAPQFGIARLNANGSRDTNFLANVNSGAEVYCLAVQADGKIFVGGTFSNLNSTARNYLGKLNADGTLDTSFNPNPNDYVRTLVLQTDGKILLGGLFTSVAGVARTHVARLETNSVADTNFNVAVSGIFTKAVTALALQTDGRILLAGDFSLVNGLSRMGFARLFNDAASQSLTIPDATRVQWLRGGSSPEVLFVSFEVSTNGGASYTSLGAGTRISGGWELTGLSLPVAGQIRARARMAAGQYSGSSSLIETIASFGPTVAFNLSAPETYVEDTPLNLSDILINSGASTNFTVTLTLSTNAAGRLSTNTAGVTTSTFNPTSGVWAATGPLADINTLLAGVTFFPATNFNASFTIATSVTDGVAPPLTGSKVMTGTPVNDAPTVSNIDAMENYTEDTPLNLIDIVITEPDGDPVTATLTLSLPEAGRLSTGTSGAVTSTYNATSGVWMASGPVVNVNALLAGLTFFPSTNSHVLCYLTVNITDGISAPITDFKSLFGIAVPDDPSGTNLSVPETYLEETPLNLTDIVVSDPDSAVTTILSLTSPLAGTLSTGTSGGVTSTFDAGSGTWYASGPVSNINALLADVVFTPATNYSELFFLQIQLTSQDGGLPVFGQKSFTPIPVNDPPTLDAILDPAAINEDAGQQTVNITGISAGGGELQGFMVTATSSNPNLIPHPTVIHNYPAIAGSLLYTPVANASGTAIITVAVNDGGASNNITTRTFTVVVNAVNDPPTLNPIGNPSPVNEDAGLRTLNFNGVSAGNGETQTLTVTATSGNTNLVPNPTVTYTSPNTNGSLSYTPVPNASGTAIITVAVNDGGASNNITTRTFTVVVNAVNDLPTLNTIGNPAPINEDAGTQTVNFNGVSSGGGESQTLAVTATSGNTNLIPNPTVTYASPNTNGSLSYTPVANASGTAIITVAVNDGGASNNITTRTFTVVVNAVNDPPTLNTITNLAIAQNAGLQTVGLTGISAGGGEAQALSVTATSGNTNVIPHPIVSYTSPATNGSLTFTPVANAAGSALITVTVNDGAVSNNVVTRTFTVTVSATGGEIGVEQPAGTPVADGGAKDFGSISVGSQTSFAFTVTNSGPASLTNLGVTLDGADASQFTLLFPQTPGTLVLTSSPPVDGNPYGVTAADVNGDGRPDLLSVSPATSRLTVLTNNGSGGFVLSSTPDVGVLPIAVVAGDVNGDGRVDIISANDVGGTLSVLTNNGSGGFVLSSSPGVGARVSAVVAGDFNGDGAIDLVAAHRGDFFTNNTLTVLTNRGGVFTIASRPVVVADPLSVAAGDFNGDGRLDLVSVGASTAELTVLTNTGVGFVPTPTPAPGLPVMSVATADVNGDGRVDLLCPYYFGVLMVMTNSGNASFLTASAPTLSTHLKQVTTADLNGDGRLDAVAIDFEASLLIVATNGGEGIFAPAYSRAVGGSPLGVAAADVTGDGKPDAITASYDESTLSVLFNNSAGVTNLPPTLAPGGSTSFTVRFAPGTIGPKTAALHLTSSDTDENPYDISLTGSGGGAVTPPAIDPRSLQRLPDGSFRFSFTNAPGLTFTVLASTNVALPHQDWTALGPVLESPAGRYLFTDPQATNTSIRFYRVRSP